MTDKQLILDTLRRMGASIAADYQLNTSGVKYCYCIFG